MATSVPPQGSEAPNSAEAPRLDPIAAAAAAAREIIANRQSAAGTTQAPDPANIPAGGTMPGTTPVPSSRPDLMRQAEAPAPEQPLSSAEAPQGDDLAQGGDPEGGNTETPQQPDLRVQIDGARPGETFEIEVSDPETADRLRQLQRAALRGDQARQVREDAQRMREQAEEFQYTVQMDPAGIIAEAITNPQDQGHLLRYLITRPGVLEQNQDWLNNMLAAPEAVGSEARLAEAERLMRRDSIRAEVEYTRKLNQNARALVQAAEKSIDTHAPDGWTEEAKAQLYSDVLSDIRSTARAEGQQMLDPKRVAGLVQRRLTLLGVAPQVRQRPVGAGTPPAGKTPAVPAAPTPETLRSQRTARQAAASAPVGAGSPAPSIPKPPPYDPSKPGGPIEQAANFARSLVRAVARRP